MKLLTKELPAAEKPEKYTLSGGFTVGQGCMLYDASANGVIEFTGAELWLGLYIKQMKFSN